MCAGLGGADTNDDDEQQSAEVETEIATGMERRREHE